MKQELCIELHYLIITIDLDIHNFNLLIFLCVNYFMHTHSIYIGLPTIVEYLGGSYIVFPTEICYNGKVIFCVVRNRKIYYNGIITHCFSKCSKCSWEYRNTVRNSIISRPFQNNCDIAGSQYLTYIHI